MDHEFVAFLPDSDPEAVAAAVDEQQARKRPKREHRAPPSPQKAATDRNLAPLPSQSNPWLRPVHSYSRKPIERLHQEIRDLVTYLSPTDAEQRARDAATDRVKDIVKRLYPQGEVRPFGSYHMGLFIPSSDIDLVVVLPDDSSAATDNSPAATTPTSSTSLDILRRVARAIGKTGIAAPRSLKVIARARVPIIKYTDSVSSYAVDVSVNVGSGLEGAKMMTRLLKRHAALKPLTLLLKHFLALRNLNEVFSGGLGSFSLMCMLVSFLDLHPLLQLGLIDEQDNVAVLLLDFLELYTKHFNYEQVGVSLVQRQYFRRLERAGWEHICKQQNGVWLSIEDPQCPDNDLARGTFQMGAVRQALEYAFLVLTSRISQCDYRPCHLLSPLVWIPERTIRHRSFIKQTSTQ